MMEDAYYAQNISGDIFVRISVEDCKKVTEFLVNDKLLHIDREWSYEYLPQYGIYELIKRETTENHETKKTNIKSISQYNADRIKNQYLF